MDDWDTEVVHHAHEAVVRGAPREQEEPFADDDASQGRLRPRDEIENAEEAEGQTARMTW